MYISHIQHVTENFSFYTTHKFYISLDFAKQIMPIVLMLQRQLSHLNGRKLDNRQV
jgi:hypothetical protein